MLLKPKIKQYSDFYIDGYNEINSFSNTYSLTEY